MENRLGENIIDVIIGVLDRPNETIRTIKTLLNTNKNIRIILVDDGSTDKVDFSGFDNIIKIETGGRLGQAKSVNMGLDIATSEYVVTMHNDIVIKDKDWILRAVNFLHDNKDAGLICGLGWQLKDGRLPYIQISTIRECYGQMPTTEDFIEVYNTDNIVNIFRNDGTRADERYGYGSYSLWIDFKARGLKLYVMRFNDSIHLPGSTRDIKAYTDVTTWEKEFALMNDVILKRMIEFNIEMPKPELK